MEKEMFRAVLWANFISVAMLITGISIVVGIKDSPMIGFIIFIILTLINLIVTGGFLILLRLLKK